MLSSTWRQETISSTAAYSNNRAAPSPAATLRGCLRAKWLKSLQRADLGHRFLCIQLENLEIFQLATMKILEILQLALGQWNLFVRPCDPCFCVKWCFGSLFGRSRSGKKSHVFFFEISFSDMCNLYHIHQASDCHKGFINILSNFLRDESGPEPPIHFPKSPFSVKGRWQGWQHAWETLLALPMKSQILSAEPCREIKVLGVSHSHDPEPSKTWSWQCAWAVTWSVCSRLFNSICPKLSKYLYLTHVEIAYTNELYILTNTYAKIYRMNTLYSTTFVVPDPALRLMNRSHIGLKQKFTRETKQQTQENNITIHLQKSFVLSLCHFLSFFDVFFHTKHVL